MKLPHLFEFMDLDWLPPSLRGTLREILECCCSPPFRTYYKWVAAEALKAAKEGGFETIVELGAGTAPITRLLAEDPDAAGIKLVVSDLNPDRTAYEALEKRYPGRVSCVMTPVDIAVPRQWEPRTLVLLSAAFHHLPPEVRPTVIAALTASADRVMIFEPLRKKLSSVGYTLLSVLPALLAPVWLLGRPGRLRRLVWCWLVPVAPPMFWWEGVVSATRMWSNREWEEALAEHSRPDRKGVVTNTAFCQMVSW